MRMVLQGIVTFSPPQAGERSGETANERAAGVGFSMGSYVSPHFAQGEGSYTWES